MEEHRAGHTPPPPTAQLARWTVHIERSVCNRTGLCVGTSPGRFELGPDHRTRPVATVVAAGDPAVLDAAECCPMEAIVVTDHQTGHRVFPE